MRVLIVGEEAPGALADSYARGFRELGAEVIRYCTVRRFASILPGSGNRLGRRLLRPLALRRFNQTIVDDLSSVRADLVLVVKGEQLGANAIRALRQNAGGPIVNFYPDDPFSAIRSNRMVFGPSVLAEYDACYTFARHLIPEYRRVGVERVFYLPFARDAALHAPPSAVSAPEFDVVFVGNLDEGRVRWLKVAAQFRLAVFGATAAPRAGFGSGLGRAKFFPPVFGKDLARAVAKGAISLNIMRRQNQGSHNMRSFESPACGAFTLSQATPELAELFRVGEEIDCFASPEELVRRVEYWLGRPSERTAVAAEGFRRVEHDTYRARAEEILATAPVNSF